MSSLRKWFIAVILAVHSLQRTQAIFTVLPANISAIAGETITLRCSALHKRDRFLYWSKGDVHISLRGGLISSLGSDILSRYKLRGNHTYGENDLTIENVTKKDAGDYQCSYLGPTGGRTSPPATVTVYVPPPAQYPLCSVRSRTKDTEASGTLWQGDSAEFICQSSGGDPPALLQWARSNQTILEPQPSHIVYPRILKPEDNGVTFTCVATSPALRQPRRCSIMPMRILPVVQVRPLTRMIIPGDNATFHCEGTAIPHVASYLWTVGGHRISDGQAGYSFANQRQLLTIHNVKQSQDQLQVSCEVSTPTGIAESASVKMVVTPIYVPPTIPTLQTSDHPDVSTEGADNSSDSEEDRINLLNGDLFMIIVTTFAALVVLLLVVAVVMGCWALLAKGKRPQTQKRPRVEYHESTCNTIDMDPLPLPTQLVYEPPTTISSDPISISATPNTAVDDREHAPGYISQLYSTLDTGRLPSSRTAFGGFSSEKPVAQITPTQNVAFTLPRMSKIEKPCGTSKPMIKECPASITITEEKVENQSADDDKEKQKLID